MLATFAVHAAADDPDVASPLVSYQFLDSLAEPSAQPNIVSQQVSYQYFDWPGDENLTFENSPPVSYFFGGGVSLALTGTVKDSTGLPVAGAEVLLQRHNTVFWQGFTAPDGTLPAATLPAGNFNVIVIKAGYTSLFQSVAGDAGGPVSLILVLQPALTVPALVTVDKTLTRPHVTIMDEAEIASVLGQNVTTAASLGWRVSQLKGLLAAGTVAAIADWKNPVPKSSTWRDNYISLVGFQRDDCVNVGLPASARAFDIRHPIQSAEAAHAYAHEWYRESIVSSGLFPQIGFRRSYERALSFPPSGSGLSHGSLWMENLETSEPRDLLLDTNPLAFEANLTILGHISVSAGNQVVSGVVDRYEAGIEWIDDVGSAAIQKTQNVTATISEKTGNWWDAAWDHATTINPETLFTGSIAAPSLKFLFSTPAPSLRAPRNAPKPPQAWFPVQVPENAGFLVFDFTVTGDPADDLIVCAVNEQNVFTLPARFAPDNSPVSTDFLDISAHAGQQVELYFGLVGGTSQGCTLAIDGIRFVTIPIPKLAATVAGNQVILKWPAAAAGWRLQRSESLAPAAWEDVVLSPETEVEDGVVTATRSRATRGLPVTFRLLLTHSPKQPEQRNP